MSRTVDLTDLHKVQAASVGTGSGRLMWHLFFLLSSSFRQRLQPQRSADVQLDGFQLLHFLKHQDKYLSSFPQQRLTRQPGQPPNPCVQLRREALGHLHASVLPAYNIGTRRGGRTNTCSRRQDTAHPPIHATRSHNTCICLFSRTSFLSRNSACCCCSSRCSFSCSSLSWRYASAFSNKPISYRFHPPFDRNFPVSMTL